MVTIDTNPLKIYHTDNLLPAFLDLRLSPLQTIELVENLGESTDSLPGLIVRRDRERKTEVAGALSADGVRSIGVESKARSKEDLGVSRQYKSRDWKLTKSSARVCQSFIMSTFVASSPFRSNASQSGCWSMCTARKTNMPAVGGMKETKGGPLLDVMPRFSSHLASTLPSIGLA